MSVLDELQTVDSPEALKQAADVLDEQAEELRSRAREIGIEAMALRRRAIEVERKPPPHPLDSLNGHRSIAEKILAILRHTGEPQKMSVILTILGETETRTRTTIEKLIERDLVVREGLKRGTTYRVPREGEEVEAPALTSQRYETTVRDAARRLGVFTFAELRETIPDLSDATLRRWLTVWVEQGALEVEPVGNANLYAVVKPKGAQPTHAPRSDPKPWALPEGCERVTNGAGRARATKRSGSSIVNALLRELRAYPQVTVVKTAHSYTFRIDGLVVASCSRTPGGTSLKETRRHLRRAGVPV